MAVLLTICADLLRRRRLLPARHPHECRSSASTCCRRGTAALADLLVELLMARDRGVHGRSTASGWCKATWHNTIAEFPFLSVGVTYLPIPIGGAITLLFIIEHVHDRPPGRCRRRPARAAGVEIRPPWTSSFSSARCSSCFAIGMPIAYSLGVGALAGALWIGIPLEAVMLQDLRRRQQGRDADDSVLRAGRRDHGRRRHGAAAGRASPT